MLHDHTSLRYESLSATLVLAILAFSTRASAQAWTPARGEGTVTVQFQDAFVKYHLFATTPIDRGHIRSNAVVFDFTYGLTDKAALTIALPYVAAKYNGPYPHPTGIDNGQYHSTFQDLRFDVRYNLTRKNLVITPYVGTIVPSHEYIYFAHSAVGRDFRQLQLGLYAAKLLDAVVPGLFVSGRYSYGFNERILDISHNQSNVDLEVGYFVKSELRLFALGTGQVTHGGIDFPNPSVWGGLPGGLPPLLFAHHDQIGRDNWLNVGVGAAYSLIPSVDLFGSVIHTVTGRNMHELEYGVTFGVSWSLVGGNQGVRSSQVPTAQDRHQSRIRSLVRCVCQKGH
jgi:hypothetical protein